MENILATCRKEWKTLTDLSKGFYGMCCSPFEVELQYLLPGLTPQQLDECGYDVQKSLNRLLDTAAASQIHHNDVSSGTSSGDNGSKGGVDWNLILSNVRAFWI